jgi:hypothetical protein
VAAASDRPATRLTAAAAATATVSSGGERSGYEAVGGVEGFASEPCTMHTYFGIKVRGDSVFFFFFRVFFKRVRSQRPQRAEAGLKRQRLFLATV